MKDPFLYEHPSRGPLPKAGSGGGSGGGKGGGVGGVMSNPSVWAAIAMSANNMSTRPNPGIARFAGQMIQDHSEEQRETARGNRTADYIEQMGYPEYAEMVRSDPSQARTVLDSVMQLKREKSFSPMTGAAYAQQHGIEPTSVYPEFLSRMLSVNDRTGEAKTLGGSGQQINVNQAQPINPGFKAYSEVVGKSVADWQQTGRTDAYTQIGQIQNVIGDLESGEAKTGLLYGSLPDWGKAWYDGDTKQAQDMVEEVVQRNLRVVLGPQFTAKESSELIRRAFNDRLSPEQNLLRLNKLNLSMQAAADSKDAMAAHFMRNQGDMSGFQGKLYTLQDFHSVFDELDAEQGVQAVSIGSKEEFDALPSGTVYIGSDGKRYRKP